MPEDAQRDIWVKSAMVICVGSCRFGNPTTYDMITTAIMLARNADAETMQRMKYKHSTTRYLNTREGTSVRSVITGFAEAMIALCATYRAETKMGSCKNICASAMRVYEKNSEQKGRVCNLKAKT